MSPVKTSSSAYQASKPLLVRTLQPRCCHYGAHTRADVVWPPAGRRGRAAPSATVGGMHCCAVEYRSWCSQFAARPAGNGTHFVSPSRLAGGIRSHRAHHICIYQVPRRCRPNAHAALNVARLTSTTTLRHYASPQSHAMHRSQTLSNGWQPYVEYVRSATLLRKQVVDYVNLHV